MVRDVLPIDSSRQDIDVVVDELDKLGHLVGRLLFLAEAYEQAQFEFAPVDLGALVRRSVQRWRPTVERSWVVRAPPVVVEADGSRLEAALDALIENAVKFTVDGDVVAVRCGATRDGCMVEVEDHGIGIGIGFDGAVSGSGPLHSSGRPGTGLGLAIVRAIAEGHGGRVTLLEDRPVGALLRIDLPPSRAAVDPDPAAERDSEPDEPRQRSDAGPG